MEDILEGNKLIAEFMGRERRYESTFEIFYANLQYNSSWDWLMTVVQKIALMGHKVKTEFMIDEYSVTILETNGLTICWEVRPSPLLSVWLAVVEFIKWYNQNKKV